MKDQDLRTETAQRKRERKRAQRRAGIPVFEFERVGLDRYRNRARRLDNGWQRLLAKTEAEIRRAKRVPFNRATYAQAIYRDSQKARAEA